jgi:hypothetical protein
MGSSDLEKVSVAGCSEYCNELSSSINAWCFFASQAALDFSGRLRFIEILNYN